MAPERKKTNLDVAARKVAATLRDHLKVLPGAPRVGFTRGSFEIPLKLVILPDAADYLPDPRQVMVVVFRHKIQMIHKAHRRLQTRVRNGLTK